MAKNAQKFLTQWGTKAEETTAPIQPPRKKPGTMVTPPNSAAAMLDEASKTVSRKISSRDIRSLDPSNCLPSLVLDRVLEEEDNELETLKESIKDQGQQVPILVRPHPEKLDLFQIAYGHRRVKACQSLGLAVQAIVKDLTDDQLVIAQGKENAERKNLSPIQKALFVKALRDKGFTQKTIVDSVGAGQPPLISKLTKIVEAIPMDIIEKVGAAPNTSRMKWEALAKFCKDKNTVSRCRNTINRSSGSQKWASSDSDARFTFVLAAAEGKEERSASEKTVYRSSDGTPLLELSGSKTALKLSLKGKNGGSFKEFLMGEIPDFIKRYEELQRREEDA